MASTKRYRTKLIRPSIDLGTLPRAFQLAGLEFDESLHPKLFDLPLIAVVLDHDRPVWMPTLFLADVGLQSRSVTGDTVRTYSEALLSWLRYLDDNAVSLNRVTEETIAVYRAHLAHAPRSGTGERYASATANNRVVIPVLFHAWGQRRAMMPSPLGRFLCDHTTDAGSRRYSTNPRYASRANSKISPPRVIKRLPLTLSHEELQRLFALVPMPYKLMFKWCLATGLRRFEVCALTRGDLPTPEQIESATDGLVGLKILRKGGREVTVYAPAKLVEETNWYVLTEKPKLCFPNEDFVFLNKQGKRISRQDLTRIFREFADQIGSKANLHRLRHTFASIVLKILEKRLSIGDEINPLKTLQVLLGHASIETSEIYVQAADVSSDAVMEALDFLYGASL
ncbi:tyrosine-type recombinase/integrase [Paraburkholderia xenovorans]|uniref:tyrosine-type recombinase/integrase n=1 Tax=Paraburkholderia xenovorans TaxID=36873 RepID=UPI0038B9BA4D